MKWIVLAIVLVIGPYTYIRWHFRKPGPAFAPYHDIKEQANVRRLLSAGFQRISVDAERPAEPLRLPGAAASVSAAPAGLPAGLGNTLVEAPRIPDAILTVTAAAAANALFAYPIEFTCTLPDNHQQPAGVQLYVRNDEVVLIPDMERLSGELLSRNRENRIRIVVPAGALKPGDYRATIAGAHASKAWKFEVK